MFEWDPPQEPNGIIIAYELTYRINGSSVVTVNSSDVSTTRFTLELAPHTRVSNISIRAYNRAGPGPTVTAGDVVIPVPPPPCKPEY